MTAAAAITIQTAPRDPDSLEKVGIFQIRLLVEKLGALQSAEQKAAFANFTIKEKAALAAQLLRNWDAQNPGQASAQPQHVNGTQPGVPTMAAPPMASAAMPMAPSPSMPMFQQPAPYMQQQPHANGAATMPMQQMPMPGVQQVDPNAVAAAAQASAPATTSGRKPRTKSDDTESSALAANVINLLNEINKNQLASTEAVSSALKETAGALDAFNKLDAKKRLETIEQCYSGVYNVLVSLDSAMKRIEFATNLSMSLSLYMAEQVLGAPRDHILSAAMGDVSAIVGTVQASQQQAAAPGKA